MADIANFRINYKSDFILTLNSDAGWLTPFCIKFWTGVPSRAYFVGWDGKEYINCKVDETDASKLIVLFDDHQLPVGQLKMQMAYHTTIEDFPGSVFDEVTNASDVIVDIEGTEHQVMLDVNGETAPEIEFNLPAYEAEAERQRAEQQRQINEQARNAAETLREQADGKRQQDTQTAIQKAEQATLEAENVNARLSSDGGVVMLTITNRQGNQTSKEVGFRIAKTYPNVASMNADIANVEEGRFVMIAGSTEDVDTGKLYVRGANAFTFITDLSGAQGIKGDTGNGIASVMLNADYTLTIVFTDGTSTTTTSIRGEKGEPGTTDYNELKNKPVLAGVATSGSYNDLKDKPNIPVVPTDVSAFNNDAGYITKSVNDLVNYYLKADVYNKTEVANLIASIQQFHYEIYASTSAVTSPAGNVLYLIGPTGAGDDRYEEYVYDSTKQEPWVKIGDTSIDLSDYYTSQQTDAAITAALNTALADYTTTANLTKLLSGKEDASNKVTSISAQSTDAQYPSAKCVYDVVGNIVTILDNINGEVI